nr:sterile alpha motif domain-containing protein 3-like [Dermacentor andersoni]
MGPWKRSSKQSPLVQFSVVWWHCHQANFRPSSSEDDGVNFVMLSLGALHEKVISGEALTSSSFRQITDILFGAMASTTLFPTRQFYNKVTSLLLDKYPQLRDVVGSGSDSWKVALRNKFKNQRRKLQDDRALQNREKFGAQRRTEAAAKELQRSKKPKMAIGLPNLTGEDETSITKHEEWLILESKKSLPNEKAMQERMALTANQRLRDLAKSTVLDVKMKYPCLMEFQRDVLCSI